MPLNASHGGLLLGLGLAGALRALAPADMYELLAAAHATTTVGLLLGLAAGRRASGDASVHKALALHAPALVRAAAPCTTASMINLEIPTVVQTCALVGLGLLQQGSCRRALVDFFALEIGGSPVSERDEEREAYCARVDAVSLTETSTVGAHTWPHHCTHNAKNERENYSRRVECRRVFSNKDY